MNSMKLMKMKIYDLLKYLDENVDNNVQYSPLAYHQRCATHTLNLIASTDINKIIKDNATLKKLHHPASGVTRWEWAPGQLIN